MRRYMAARHDDHRDLDGRLSSLSADCPLTFTPLAAEPVVYAIPLTIGVAIPRHCGIVNLSKGAIPHNAILGLLLCD
jgi:hypothetical protein